MQDSSEYGIIDLLVGKENAGMKNPRVLSDIEKQKIKNSLLSSIEKMLSAESRSCTARANKKKMRVEERNAEMCEAIRLAEMSRELGEIQQS